MLEDESEKKLQSWTRSVMVSDDNKSSESSGKEKLSTAVPAIILSSLAEKEESPAGEVGNDKETVLWIGHTIAQ